MKSFIKDWRMWMFLPFALIIAISVFIPIILISTIENIEISTRKLKARCYEYYKNKNF